MLADQSLGAVLPATRCHGIRNRRRPVAASGAAMTEPTLEGGMGLWCGRLEALLFRRAHLMCRVWTHPPAGGIWGECLSSTQSSPQVQTLEGSS